MQVNPTKGSRNHARNKASSSEYAMKALLDITGILLYLAVLASAYAWITR